MINLLIVLYLKTAIKLWCYKEHSLVTQKKHNFAIGLLEVELYISNKSSCFLYNPKIFTQNVMIINHIDFYCFADIEIGVQIQTPSYIKPRQRKKSFCKT